MGANDEQLKKAGRCTVKKSIVTDDMDFCIVCGRPRDHVHHVFFGTCNRNISDKHGFIVPLCWEHHEGNTGVHNNQVLDQKLKQYAQRKYEALGHSRKEFRALFGKNYL